jgi:hypothetical protein
MLMTVRQLLHRHFIERFQRGETTQTVSPQGIEHIASTLNVILPASYRDFLETYGPVYTPDILDLIVLRNARLADIQQFQSIEDVIDSSQSLEAKGCLAFAADWQGNFFALGALRTLFLPQMMPRFGCLITKQERHSRLLYRSMPSFPNTQTYNLCCKTEHRHFHHAP